MKRRSRSRSQNKRRSRSPKRRSKSRRKPRAKSRLKQTKKIRVGTDCSGTEAPIQALQQLGIPFTHEFSSEINPHCVKSIVANYDPKILFGHDEGYKEGDITKRDIKKVPNIDLYVCGFPCQPFSAAGSRKGMYDPRGNVFYGCTKVIDKKTPRFFILENVPGILSSNKGKDWEVIKEELNRLKKKHGYSISWKVLNTKDYGIPQNRRRLFIVGRLDGKKYEWPKPVKMKPLTSYIDYTDKSKKKLTENKNGWLAR